jgi:hypothetical protein
VKASVAMVARPAVPVAQGSFEVGYVSEEQFEHWAPVAGALAVPFERCAPVREFTSKKGQRHLSGPPGRCPGRGPDRVLVSTDRPGVPRSR